MQITEWIFRGAGMIVAVVMLIWFVMPAFIDVWNVGYVVGIICCVWLFVISCKPLQHAVRELCGHGLALGIYRAVNGVFIAFLAYGLIVTCVMILAANAQPEPGATALVLGAHVHKSGSPSSILYGRLRAAEKYLADNPDSAAAMLLTDKLKGAPLILCGHTHGGQFRIPGFGAVVTSSRFRKRLEYGAYRHSSTGATMYVSAGIGATWFNARICCPPEVLFVNFC